MLAQQTFERPQHAGIVVDDINQLLSRQALSCSARRRTVLRVDVGRYTPETPRSVLRTRPGPSAHLLCEKRQISNCPLGQLETINTGPMPADSGLNPPSRAFRQPR